MSMYTCGLAHTPLQGGLKQCNQALNKYPKNNVFTVLKALALDRLGNAQDALYLVENIIATGTSDDEVLHHCSNLLKSHGEYETLLRLNKGAAASKPQDLGLLQVRSVLRRSHGMARCIS
jgi:hypothetical protein